MVTIKNTKRRAITSITIDPGVREFLKKKARADNQKLGSSEKRVSVSDLLEYAAKKTYKIDSEKE